MPRPLGPLTLRTILFAAVGGLLVYEVSTIINDRDGDTISELLWAASHRPLVPFAAGVVCGHLFWQKANGRVAGPR